MVKLLVMCGIVFRALGGGGDGFKSRHGDWGLCGFPQCLQIGTIVLFTFSGGIC
jgi:hypothetical protein